MKKKLITSILALTCAIACAFSLAACGGGSGGPMKLNEEQWDSAFTAARAWKDYTLNFRLSLNKNYVMTKDRFDTGVTVQDVIMRFSLDSTNEQGLRASSSQGISVYNEDGSVISEDDYSSYHSVENGKLFSYYYDENSHARKYESTTGTGTAEERFAECIETFDDYLPMFVFKKGGKTYKIDELNQALKFTPGYAYEGKLGFELNLEANGGGYENENPYKTESAPVTLSVYHTVYDTDGSFEWTNKLPEDWSEWEGGIQVKLHFETEYNGEKYLVMVEMSYESNHYAIDLPDTLYGTRYEDGEQHDYDYKNVYGQAGPAQSD